jgi:hypothetical protein
MFKTNIASSKTAALSPCVECGLPIIVIQLELILNRHDIDVAVILGT